MSRTGETLRTLLRPASTESLAGPHGAARPRPHEASARTGRACYSRPGLARRSVGPYLFGPYPVAAVLFAALAVVRGPATGGVTEEDRTSRAEVVERRLS